ncbi:unnamed protein product [Boreogadus saida]
MGRFRFERAYKRRRRETGWLITSGSYPDDGTSPSQHPSEERKKKKEEQRFIQEPAASEASSTVPRVSVGEGVSSPELRDDPWGLLGLLQGVPGSSG